MGNTNIIFGRYKGKGIEKMLNDMTYCRWLSGQSWLKDFVEVQNAIKDRYPQFFKETKKEEPALFEGIINLTNKK